MENCNTILAAPIRSAGILSLLFKNQIPTTSAITIIAAAINKWILTAVTKVFLNCSLSPTPKAKVRNRLVATDIAPVKTENMVTKPPTTL